MPRYLTGLYGLAMALCLVLCPVTARAQRTDPQAELELGRQTALYVKRTMPMSRNEAMCVRVQRVGAAISEQLEQKAYPYEFNVIASPEINAFALPGGFIFIYEGLLTRIPDDNALAAVLAHEVTHIAHRHWAEVTKKMQVVNLLAVVTSVAINDRDGRIASVVSTLTSLHYTRTNEYDADQFAIELVWRAGYDPNGGITLMNLFLEQEKGNTTPTYLRTHPPCKSRREKIQAHCTTLARRARPVAAPASSQPAEAPSGDIVGDLGELAPVATRWYPLAVGNRWEYAVEGQHTRSTYALRVVGSIPTRQGTVFRVETVLAATAVQSQVLTTANEVWRRGRVTTADSPWRLDAVFDATAQEQAVDGVTYAVIGMEELNLPCGHFANVRHIRKTVMTPDTATIDLWFAEDIGLLKRSCIETGISETLIRFTLPQQACAINAE